MFTNGKILEWLKQNSSRILLIIGISFVGFVCLHFCQNSTQLSLKNNKVIISKTKTK